MQDDFNSPAWADNHARSSATIHKAIGSILIGLERLNAYQFDAPWRHERTSADCAGHRTRA